LENQVCVITGGQAGIGKEIVAQLLIRGISKVYVLARNPKKFELVLKFWEKSHQLKADVTACRVEFIICDLSDMIAVKKAAEELMRKLDRLDILINNAGL
jgi:NAD(P)-dependent dehydrogenase (short-subunit alcohol dehydrogenase family)